MKKINYLFFILLSYNTIFCQQLPEKNSLTSLKEYTQQLPLFIKKNAFIITALPLIIYNHHSIKNFLFDHPYMSSISFYFFLNYLCDSILNYQQQEKLFEIITMLKKTTLYLVTCHGIKNYLIEEKLLEKKNSKNFLDSITQHLHYSFDEITLIALKAYQELKISLQDLNMNLNIESEEFVFLCHAQTITIQSLLYLAQHDFVLYKAIYYFEREPESHLQHLVEYLQTQITKTFLDLEKKLLIAPLTTAIIS
ncbi:MAG: hypothetical protein ACXWL2_00545 [Candidatus Chromulinivorax sp.]